mmetsp:Transcript_102639/g.319845  ORF Transcript_102639/g.319845 Transcript_102639/m.319845 type:complete len:611 (+) Transcript_102639:310-2142(+)
MTLPAAASLQRLSGPLDALPHEVCKSVDSRIVKQQGAGKIDARELLHQLVSELHHGQTVQAGVHERSVSGQRLDAHQTVRHVVDLQPQHRRVNLPLIAPALAASASTHGSDHILDVVCQPLPPLVVALLCKGQGLVGDLRRLCALLVDDVAVGRQDHGHHLALLVALGRAQLLGRGDALHGLGRPLGDDVHLGDAKGHREHEPLLSALLAELQRLLLGLQGFLRDARWGRALGAGEALLNEQRELDGGQEAQHGGLARLLTQLLHQGQALLRCPERRGGVPGERLDLRDLEERAGLPALVLFLLEDELGLRGRRDRLVVLLEHPEDRAHHQERAALGVLVAGLCQQLLGLPGGLHRLCEPLLLHVDGHGQVVRGRLERRVVHVHAHGDHLLHARQRLAPLPPLALDAPDRMEDGDLQPPVLQVAREGERLLRAGQRAVGVLLLDERVGEQVEGVSLALRVPGLPEAGQRLLDQLHTCLRLLVFHIGVDDGAQELRVPGLVLADILCNGQCLLGCRQRLSGSILAEVQLGDGVVFECLHLLVAKLRERAQRSLEGLQCRIELLIIEASHAQGMPCPCLSLLVPKLLKCGKSFVCSRQGLRLVLLHAVNLDH